MTGAVPLHTHARVSGVDRPEILKVLSPEEAVGSHLPPQDVLLFAEGIDGPSLTRPGDAPARVEDLRDRRVIRPGDVVRLRPGGSLVSVLYRRGSTSNTLFATERCNSLCLMCSQPPRDEDDRWRVDEMLRVISLVDREELQLGITGGEPTLLGEDLARVLDAISVYLPDTQVQILTNGRTFADAALAERLATIHRDRTVWAVPLYGDVARLHDEVVDVEGAFRETLDGLYQLGRLRARVEIRVVLHQLTIPRLAQLSAFIYRRLPFVNHVALMGLEPMGFAKTNRDRLWIDPADYQAELAAAVFHLAARGLPVSIYNLPLCVLDRRLWPFARQSISGWKNIYPPDCKDCVVRDHCAGFFASAGPTWRSRAVRPFQFEEFAA
ncbi:MAG: His-Xaa-Ser system radical SAM maturase HxsC [Phenylobacterium sp.]|uniref:His-Xaa-Ser system radical SAM maturase HxsC n=1 Tax=Phenylobacterium sp. TaxID=1871053 RepID=UPI001207D6AC|nr:His-Xaa-Ser system radical SAM maturase HxsC [Phenylobacterium sp.]TAL34952.1 MAG: His-Xaa-Ser system radical SAM maturase HxsC [Phenylobacterium sp.]